MRHYPLFQIIDEEAAVTNDDGEKVDSCALCGQPVDEKAVAICRANPERFGGRVLCQEHQRRFSACPALRSPQHR